MSTRTLRACIAALAAMLLRCEDAPPSPAKSARPAMTSVAPTADLSLYQLDTIWEDDRGARVSLDLWRGSPVAVVLFFGTCESACPAVVHELQRIESELPAAARDDLRALLVTIDPERDDVASLAAYVREHGLPRERWRLLRGDDASVRELAAALGVRYRRLADGTFSHSLRISFLDRKGAIVHRVDELGRPVDEVAAWLAKGEHS